MGGRTRTRTVCVVALAACIVAALTTAVPSTAAEPSGEMVLRVGLSRWSADSPDTFDLDPQSQYWFGGWALLECCLARTLMGYPDVPIDEGGGDLQPDLAADYPTVSLDGLTWTFHLKQGLHYAPPLQAIEITAPDIKRAVERVASFGVEGSYADPYFAPIEGFERMLEGRAPAVSGLVTPDPYTLEVHLTEPVGDVGERLSVPAAAPIAPYGDRPLGVAQGYGTLEAGAHTVSTGPYMFEGSPQLDFSEPGRRAHAMYRPKDPTWVWVRNPSYDASTDPLRAALPDRIEFTVTTGRSFSVEVVRAHNDQVVGWVRDGAVDIAMTASGRGMTSEARESWGSDPEWSGSMVPTRAPIEMFFGFRLAVPPFDDVHVRRAVALAMDREAFIVGMDGEWIAQRHLTLDQYTENILANYDPYPGGDARAAALEMARSSYDADHDGRCDAASCRRVVFRCGCLPAERAILRPLRGLGMLVDFQRSPGSFIDISETSIGLFVFGWGYDWQDAYTFFSSVLSTGSQTLIGERPSTLRAFDYPVTRVPSLDAPIQACERLAGPARAWCWARVDQFAMEDVVAMLPLGRGVSYWAKGPRITSYGLSWHAVPALDRMVVETSAT